MKATLAVSSAVLVVITNVAVVFACTCPGDPPFEQTIRESPIVFVGSIATVSRTVPEWRSFEGERPSPVYVDVIVERVLKGKQVPKRVRIWDQQYGSSCEGVLEQLSRQPLAVIALNLVSAEEVKANERHRRTGVYAPPLKGGEHVFKVCRQGWVAIKSVHEADRWAKRVR